MRHSQRPGCVSDGQETLPEEEHTLSRRIIRSLKPQLDGSRWDASSTIGAHSRDTLLRRVESAIRRAGLDADVW